MTGEVRGLVTASIQGKPGNDFVFTHDDGSPVKDFRGAWKAMFRDAGVERKLLHDMRRSAVRNAIRRGVDRDTVKKMSGHLTDAVFSRYNIQAVDDLEDAAQKIEPVLPEREQPQLKPQLTGKRPKRPRKRTGRCSEKAALSLS
jgi:integrase